MSSIINADTSSGLTISSDNSGEIDFQSGGVTKAGINSAGWTGDGSQLTNVGKVLQVVSVEKTDVFSTTSVMPTYADITGLSATITPSLSSNKILVTISVKVSNFTGYFSTQLKRQIGGASFTIVHGGDGSFPSLGTAYARANIEFYLATMQQGGTFLNSPNTTQPVTFKVAAAASTGTCWVNRTGYSAPDALRPHTSSTITLMEVAG